jgi:hypothetical protein
VWGLWVKSRALLPAVAHDDCYTPPNVPQQREVLASMVEPVTKFFAEVNDAAKNDETAEVSAGPCAPASPGPPAQLPANRVAAHHALVPPPPLPGST